VQTVQERGGAGGAQPPLNCLTHLNAALQCKDQAAISEMVEQEQWGAKQECSPPKSLTTFGTTSMQVQLQCRRRLRPIVCDPQDHTLLVFVPSCRMCPFVAPKILHNSTHCACSVAARALLIHVCSCGKHEPKKWCLPYTLWFNVMNICPDGGVLACFLKHATPSNLRPPQVHPGHLPG